jgi:methionyl aminopeptidase
MINLYTAEEIAKIRGACRIVYRVLRKIETLIEPDARTIDINDEIGRLIRGEGATPAFLGYRGFPRESCISVNEAVVHGIPGNRRLKPGDLVSVDIGVLKDGFYGDAAFTYPVGRIDGEKQKLIDVTQRALDEGIRAAVTGNRIGDISGVIEDTVTAEGCSSVRDLVGHGIGRNLHEEPQVPNFRSRNGGCRIQEGMVMAIEPMINLGTYEVETLEDDWTVVTKDRKPSAHFEHTIAIVDGKADILSIE